MDLEFIMPWPEGIRTEENRRFNVIASIANPIEGFKERYRGTIYDMEAVDEYISNINMFYSDIEGMKKALNSNNKGNNGHKIAPIRDEEGARVYCIGPLLPEEKETIHPVWMLIKSLNSLEIMHAIAPRNKTVTDQDYYTFFKGDAIWKPSDYKKETYLEMLQQTIYEMKNSSPEIYNWTNVNSPNWLFPLIHKDKAFAQFFKSELRLVYEGILYQKHEPFEGLSVIEKRLSEYKSKYPDCGL